MTIERRRLLLRTTLVITLGFLTNLAIAWSLAAFRPIPMYFRTTVGAFERWGIPWHIGRVDRPGIIEVWWMDLRVDFPSAEPAVIVDESRALNAEHAAEGLAVRLDDRPQHWGTFARRVPPPSAYQIGSDTAFGWPIPCFWYQALGVSGRDPQNNPTIDHERLVGGLLLHGEVSARVHNFHALPLLLRWPALLADTALLGVLWAFVLFLPGILRRALRARRGRCMACGYDLAATLSSSPCPECGRVRGSRHQSVLIPPPAS